MQIVNIDCSTGEQTEIPISLSIIGGKVYYRGDGIETTYLCEEEIREQTDTEIIIKKAVISEDGQNYEYVEVRREPNPESNE